MSSNNVSRVNAVVLIVVILLISTGLVFVFPWTFCPVVGTIGGALGYRLAIKRGKSRMALRIETVFGAAIGGALGSEVQLLVAVMKDPTASWSEVWPMMVAAIVFGAVIGGVTGAIFSPIVASIFDDDRAA